MGGKKEIYRDVRFFHGAILLWPHALHAATNDSLVWGPAGTGPRLSEHKSVTLSTKPRLLL